MIDISWQQLDKNSSSKELNFESFCFQVAMKKYKEYGSFESYYNTPGSEFYLELSKDCKDLNAKAGDIIGWQAKFWLNKKDENNSPLDVKHRKELAQGLTKSLEYKPNLNHWIICTPGKFSNTITKSKEPPWISLVKELNKIKQNIQLSHWNRDIFETFFHSNPEGFSSIFNLYFNSKLISKRLLNNFTEINLKQLERKFDVELHIKEEGEIILTQSIHPDKAFNDISRYVKLLDDVDDDNNRDSRISVERFHELPEDLFKLIKSYYSKHIEIFRDVEIITQSQIDIYDMAFRIKTVIRGFIESREPERELINDQLNQIFKKSNKSHINYRDEDWVQFMIQCVNDVSDLLIGSKKDNSLLKAAERILLKDVHVFGAAGYGKTHFACSIAYNLLRKKYPTLLFLGSSFRNSIAPRQRILQLLDLDNSYTFKDFLGALDILGGIYGIKIPFIIDGLNESYPSAGEIWNSEIYLLINEVRSFSNIFLITTCREKRDYIQQIYDRDSYIEVDNYTYLEGFTQNNLKRAVDKYFEKYMIKASSKPYDVTLFENPLRLKIFCEVNKGKNELDINLFSIVESIENYVNSLINKISIKNHAINAIRKSKLEKGLQDIGKILWNTNRREIPFPEFYPLFEEELSFNLIDEGLCFQRDLNRDCEMVQYTYDLVGGYQIAKSVFFTNASTSSILEDLQSAETHVKLLSKDKTKRHPLHEDILKSISYLLPIKTGKQIYEVISEDSFLFECIGNIELLTSNQSDKTKFIEFINHKSLNPKLIRAIFQKLYDDVQRDQFNSFDIITPIFLKLSQYEIDNYWNEIIRKDSYRLQLKIKQILRNGNEIDVNIENILVFILLLTGVTDKLLRSEATLCLMQLSSKYPDYILRLVKTFKLVDDGFIIESLICALTGVTLRLRNKDFTVIVINYLQEEFLKENPTNHIAILDYIHTIFDFGSTNYGIKNDKTLLSRNIDENWILDNAKTQKLLDKDSIWSYEMMDYYFIKYQITSLSKESYRSISEYSKAEIISLISQRIRQKGYDKKKYSEFESKIIEDNKYSREGVSDKVITYSKKFLVTTYLELAGFLMLNNQIKPEYKNTLRFSYLFFDPSFPEIKNKTQIINDCFLPAYNEGIQEWIIEDSSKLLREHYIKTPYFEKSEMVLLYASIIQKNESNNTYLVIHINSILFASRQKVDIQNILEPHYANGPDDLSQIFGGEIPWRLHIDPEDEEVIDIHSKGYYWSTNMYSWSSWTQDRYQNPNFVFLNSRVANKMGLEFRLENLSHFDKNGKSVTKLFKIDNSEFLYIDRKALESYLNESNSELVWNKFISKYGEFGIHKDKKLDPSFKDFKSIDFYSDIARMSNPN